MRWPRFIIATFLCAVALVLPYRPRLAYFRFVSAAVHLPFRCFGALARFLLRQTGTENPYV